MTAAVDVLPYGSNFEHLEDELGWLDAVIRLRAATLDLLNRSAPEAQTSRTAFITPEEVEWLVGPDGAATPDDAAAAADAAALLRAEVSQRRAAIDHRLARSAEIDVFLALVQLARLFGLSAFERAAVVICLAPELRRKYDRLYAYLQDDITRKKPSVDLVLDLLCDGEHARWQARGLLSDNATLLRAPLLRTAEDPHSPSGSSGLAQFLTLDPRICEFLLGCDEPDARLAGYARLHRPPGATDAPPVDPAIAAGIWNLVEHHFSRDRNRRRKLVVHLHGRRGVGRRELALHLCGRLGSSLLSVDAEALLSRGADAEHLLRLAFREGSLQQALLFVEHGDVLLSDAGRPLLKAMQVAACEYGWLLFLSSGAPWSDEETFPDCLLHSVELPLPDVPLRTTVWEQCLAGLGPESSSWAMQLASQFRLTPGQIRTAVEAAQNTRLSHAGAASVTPADLAAACRGLARHKLRDLAVKVEPRCGWDDIVLPDDRVAHLREVCGQIRHHYRVFETWGFGRKISRGQGLSALFTGPSGTGKTMAAEILAHELGLDLYKVDLSGVVSKYIGETEKNLSRIFAEADACNAILFFDEADALFGKRTEVSEAHDRYANIEISYLLQKMEAYDGTVILATNLRENMDEAFTRRIRFVIDFPFPDEANRRRIWRSHFPQEAPMAPDIDYDFLAREFPVAGGSIKNIVLNAAFLAAVGGGGDSGDHDGQPGAIGMRELVHGARREFAKIGKLWNEQQTTPTR